MGLLTDPSAGQGRLTKALLKYYVSLCALLYLSGIAWFLSLANPSMNASTYFSENALLPGLVKNEFYDDTAAAKIYHEELLDEMKKYDNSVPYPWLLAKFKQLGLDTYTHNFTLNYPLGKAQKFTGKNVYGILRAARASSTEALVLSVPYRPPSSMHATTAPSIAIMLAFAKFANKEKYWAKDIIFLITEHEQLGIQAWLEAYHGTVCGNEGILEAGDLKGRAGAIQAAINLELHDILIGQIDIKVEGLNGQLPNLDLFNLAAKMCLKEGVFYTFKNRPSKSFKQPVKDWLYSFQTLLHMISTQATGIPNGNHGLYHRFGIEALTIEGFSALNVKGSSSAGMLSIGRIIEGIFRSLNNLLERFHQSFFFYLLSSSDRFVSIGVYMPVVCLAAGALFIKACAMWCQLQRDKSKDAVVETEKKGEKVEVASQLSTKPRWSDEFWDEMEDSFRAEVGKEQPPDEDSFNFATVLLVFLTTHAAGVLIMNSPSLITAFGTRYGYTTDASLFYALVAIFVLLSFVPKLVPFRNCQKSMTILTIFSLLELGTAMICLAMTNFSLALCFTVILVPMALTVQVTSCKFHAYFQKVMWMVMAHPLLMLTLTVITYTYVMFPGDGLKEIFDRGITATQQAIVFSIVDSMIYGNWLFSVVTCIFIPNWLCFWVVAFAELRTKEEVSETKKTN